LTSLTSSKFKFEWQSSHQQAFDKIKKVIATEVFLCYPDFNNPLYLYTDALGHQLGAVIMQDKNPIGHGIEFVKVKYRPKAVYNH
jgi:hypothetical protein